MGRRIQSTAGSAVTRFLYSGHRVIEERDDTGAVLASYVYGRGLDEVVSMGCDVLDDATGAFNPDENAEDYFYLGDLQNNTLILVDADGQMVEAYAYGSELRPYAHFEGGATAYQYPNDFGMPAILDEYGDVLHIDFSRTGLPAHIQPPPDVAAGSPYQSRYANPYLFNGRRWDAELGLYYYRNRHLDPIQGRFTARDPIGIWGDPMNLGNGYAYVGNNPWTYVDPFGTVTLGEIRDYVFGSIINGGTLEGNIDATSLQYATPLQVWTGATMHANQGNMELGGDAVQFGVQVGVGLGIDRGVGAAGGAALEAAAELNWWQRNISKPVANGFGRICARLGIGVAETAYDARRAGVEVLEDGREVFYRAMSREHYDILANTGRLTPTGETFISTSFEYADQYRGVLVEFIVKPGTTQALVNNGVRDVSRLVQDSGLAHLPIGESGWGELHALFKGEGEVLNVGLGRGAALELFSDSIQSITNLGAR